MGTDYALACGDCLEFIDLHKWSIHEEAGRCLVAACNLSHYPQRSFIAQVLEYYSKHSSWFLSEQLRDDLKALKQAFEQEVSAID